MKIEQVARIDGELVAAFGRLVPQLSSAPPPAAAELQDIVDGRCVLLVARAAPGAPIDGTLTLTFYRIPTGLQARIDDVVVDAAARGKGVAEALSAEAIRRARDAGARNLTLTSRPDRAAANRLYQRLGFQRIETNVYRLSLVG